MRDGNGFVGLLLKGGFNGFERGAGANGGFELSRLATVGGDAVGKGIGEVACRVVRWESEAWRGGGSLPL